MDLDIRFDNNTKKWYSNNIILSDNVIRDILATPDSTINKIKAGEELRFGNVKRVPIDKYGRFLVNYQGRYNTAEFNRAFQHLSYYDVTKNRLDPGFYQGKIFILGSAAPALFDFVPGPHEENNPAVLIHATIIKNILNDSYMVMLGERYQKVIIALLAIICMLLGIYLKSYWSIGISVLIATIYTLVAYLYFEDGLYIGVVRQLFAILATNVMALIVQFYYESREKRFLDNAFKGRCVASTRWIPTARAFAARRLTFFSISLPATIIKSAISSIIRIFRCQLKDLHETVTGNGLTKTSLIIVGGCMGDEYMRSLLYHPHFTTEFRQGTPED